LWIRSPIEVMGPFEEQWSPFGRVHFFRYAKDFRGNDGMEADAGRNDLLPADRVFPAQPLARRLRLLKD